MRYNAYRMLVLLLIFSLIFIFKSIRVKPKEPRYVLYWSPFWSRDYYDMGYGFGPFQKCKYKNCYATDNRAMLPLERFDALIFHASTYSAKRHGVPWTRSPHQRYIFMNLEPPNYICPNLRKYASYFNWTMTYRFDSDIVRRHGYLVQEKTNYAMPTGEFLNNKTKMAAWFVSNCVTRSQRETLSEEIKKMIPVDVFGECGSLQCEKKEGSPKLSSPKCYEMTEKNYKFYFSFENSYCKDYATEKLYNLLQKDIIPVVYGGGDYKTSAPPHSVINVEDFDSVEALVAYLKYLNENSEAYKSYFEWKKAYKIVQSAKMAACQICEKLHQSSPEKIYHDLHGWWWGKNNSVCQTDKELPKIISDISKISRI